jgi:4'-phosphopantetheinyl transferase EntD
MSLSGLLPPDVVLIEGTGHDRPEVMPEERAHVSGAVPKRRTEFEQGRTCARRALRRLGIEGWPLLPGPKREPRWPPGVVGAITHTDGYVAAAVVRRPAGWGLGIDAEQRVPLSDGVGALVCTDDERRWCRERAGSGVPWEAVVFSAKESIFKAWFPLTGRWLDYLDADIELDPADDGATGAFRVLDLRAGAGGPGPADYRGRFVVTRHLVLTTAVVEPCGGA